MVDNSRITGQLNLALGSLYIDDYKLSMDINATFSGPFDSKHMVASNGVLSDEGVQKYFSGSASDFIFPIGSNKLYCPATFTFTSTNAGSITIVPVALAHPADNAPTNDQLNHYWKVQTTGFSGLISSSQVYNYESNLLKAMKAIIMVLFIAILAGQIMAPLLLILRRIPLPLTVRICLQVNILQEKLQTLPSCINYIV